MCQCWITSALQLSRWYRGHGKTKQPSVHHSLLIQKYKKPWRCICGWSNNKDGLTDPLKFGFNQPPRAGLLVGLLILGSPNWNFRWNYILVAQNQWLAPLFQCCSGLKPWLYQPFLSPRFSFLLALPAPFHHGCYFGNLTGMHRKWHKMTMCLKVFRW